MKQDNGNHAVDSRDEDIMDIAEERDRLKALNAELVGALESITALVVNLFDNQGVTAYSTDSARINAARAALAKARE